LSKLVGVIIFIVILLAGTDNAYAIDVNDCSTLSTGGSIYNLTTSITDSTNTTCINITADNVILDCGGYTIDGIDNPNTYGVWMYGRSGVTIKNCNLSDWRYGVYMNMSSDVVVDTNNLSSNYHGVEMMNSMYNNMTDNVGMSVNNDFYMENATYSRITGNVMNNSDIGVYLVTGSNSNIISGNVYESTNTHAIYVSQSYSNIFTDSIVTGSSGNDIYNFAGSTNFVNVSVDPSKISVDAGSVNIKWYVDVIVMAEGGGPLDQANVTINNIFNATSFNGLTNSSGYITRQNLTQYHHNFSGHFTHNNYTINVTKGVYISNQTTVNVTSNSIYTMYLSSPPVPLLDLKIYTYGLVEKDIFRPGDMMRIRATVTHGLGRTYLNNTTVLIDNNLGATVINNELMTNVTETANGYIYEYNYTLPSNAGGLWFINVTTTDDLDVKAYGSKKIAATPVTMQIKLVLNNTSDNIYIPGTGEISFASLSTSEYSTPNKYYAASYSNNVLKGVVFSYMSPLSVITEKGSSIYGIGTSQRMSNSEAFIVLSKGNWRNINNRIESIESNDFLLEPEPSFSYGTGGEYPLKLLLDYSNIDINKTLKIERGFSKLTVEKLGMSGNKVNIEINRI
jgi:parallel beta-helix repeat protein